MVQSDGKYYEIALDDVSHRNVIIPRERLKDYIGIPNKVVYRSMYSFSKTILDHFRVLKSVASFKDVCYIEKLVFDIDCHKGDLVKDLKDGVLRTIELISQLSEMTGTSQYSIPIWFSGRGFHLQTPDFFNFKPSTYLREEVLSTMKHHFPFIDHKPYMKTGLIRVNYSYNDKSNLYKIPLHLDHLDNVEYILEMAKTPFDENGKLKEIKWEDWDGYYLSDKIIVETRKASNEKSKYQVTRLVTCIQKMYKEGPIQGSRHDVFLRMATAWRGKLGLTYEQSFILFKEYFKGEWSDYEINNQLTSVWNKMYNPYSCTDSIMAKYCDPDCIYYRGKNFSITVPDTMTIEQKLRENLLQEDEGTFDLDNVFELGVECKFRQGNMIVIFGHPKIGKSFFYQFLVHSSKKKTLYYTLEMSDEETYERQVAIALKESVDDVEDRIKNGEELHDKVSNVTFIGRSPNLDEIKNHILQFEPEWVVIDPIDKVYEDSFKGNETGRITHLFQEFKKMALECKVVILIVQHIPGSEGKDKNGNLKSLDLWSGLSSKEGARSGDKILGWEGYQNSNIRHLRSLALRRGDHFRKQIEYSKELSMLYPINEPAKEN